MITTTLGAFATLLVLYRILNQPGPNDFIEVKFGAFLGFLSVLAIAAGGYRSMRDEEGEDAPMPTDVRPTPAPEGPGDPTPPPEAEPRADGDPRIGAMLSRDQVLHVARLARLELSEEELEVMAGELSGVLGHIEKISELGDLEDVQPTTPRRRRRERAARRRAAAVAAARGRARERARRGAGRLPRAQPGRRAGMSELLELTAAQAAEGVRTGTVDPGELWTAYRERALADELNAFSWVSGEVTPPEVERNAPLGGVPVAVKDLFCTEGIPSQAGSKILEGYRPPYTATAVERLTSAGAPLLAKTHQDEFAMGSSTENCAYGPVLNPWDRSRVPGGSSGGSAAAVAVGRGAVGDRHRHRRLDPPARGAVRDRRAQADLRRGLALRDDRLRLLARPGRPADARRHRLRAAVRRDGRPGPVRLDLARRSRSRSALPTATDLSGVRLGVPEELSGEGIEEGVLKTFRETPRPSRASSAPRSSTSRSRTRRTRSPPTT